MQTIPSKPKFRNADSYHAELVDVTENGTTPHTEIVQRIMNAWWDDDDRAAELALADLFDFFGDHERATDARKFIAQQDAIKAGRGFKPTGADWMPLI